MDKHSKSRSWSDALRAFGLIILPITLVYLAMFVTTVFFNSNGSLDPGWILGLGLAPLRDTWPWSITGLLCIILLTFALPRKRRFWFLLALTTIYAIIMLFLFIPAATFSPSLYN